MCKIYLITVLTCELSGNHMNLSVTLFEYVTSNVNKWFHSFQVTHVQSLKTTCDKT